jgi:hypothetical protein
VDLTEPSSGKLVPFAPSLLLSSFKRHYREGEQVMVMAALANFTTKALVVNKRLRMFVDYQYSELFELRFQIIGPDNAPIAPVKVMENWQQWDIIPEDFVELLPSGQWRQEIVLSSYYDLSWRGVYRIIAEYHNGHAGHRFGLDAWTGELRSAPIEVVIRE